MKRFSVLVMLCLICCFNVSAQFNKVINKDSLFQSILKNIPDSIKSEVIKSYNSDNEEQKESLLFWLSMPSSSKKELIENINLNYEKIKILITEYSKLVPPGYTVSIEFNAANNIISSKETIDLEITLKKNKETKVTQDWNLDYNTKKLNQMLAMLKWNNNTLATIKKLLSAAHCISIENGKEATIGFARSGLGKYSYIIFNKDLTASQAKGYYNNGCEYIFYKKNIVLEYGGGAAGPQCFPDK